MIKTRFAPSPTGYLHIGGARTALFSWAWARQCGGQFLLRIEDTDAMRSTAAHSEAIVRAMEWLGLSPDAPPIFQSANATRHRQVVQRLLDEGRAYRCYCTPEELTAMREAQVAAGQTPRYDRRWRNSRKPPPQNISPVVRFKMPIDGITTFDDAVKGALSVDNSELDDFIICRSDGSPTYNLAAVVDDVDAVITHVIRGDDHVMNTFRQWHIFSALQYLPIFAHLPMILTADGANEDGSTRYARMSKRNAAVDIDNYRQDGFLAQALCNYLARLSWACGDAEVFSREFFIENFTFDAVSQSPARFDVDKLRWLNREHLRTLPPATARDIADISNLVGDGAIALLLERAGTLNEVSDDAAVFARAPVLNKPLLAEHFSSESGATMLGLSTALAAIPEWTTDAIKETIRDFGKNAKLNFRQLAMPLRIVLFGKTDFADISRSMQALGRDETLARLKVLKEYINV